MNEPHRDRAPQEPSRRLNLEGWVEGLAQAVAAGIERQTSEQGLAAIEFTLMRVLAENPDCTLQELGRALPIQAEQLQTLVQRLVERGLLHDPDSDRGEGPEVVALTQSGRELVWRLHLGVQAEESRLLAGVTPEEMETLSAVVSRIMANHAALDRPA